MEPTKIVHLDLTSLADSNQDVTTIDMDGVQLVDGQTAEAVCILNEDLSSVTALFPTGVEIDPTPIILEQDQIEDISTLPDSPTEQVMHLQIQQEPVADSQVNEGGHHVFYVYRDEYKCGACNKSFEDIVDFLQHKSQHSIGENVFKCELCKLILLSRKDLQGHYTAEHNLVFAEEQPPVINSEQNNESELKSQLKSGTKKVPRKSDNTRKQKLKATEDVSEAATEISNDLNEIVKNVSSDAIAEEELDESGPLEDDEKESEKKIEQVKDFSFIMLSETIKGAKITYTRTWFKCLHCDFRSRMKRCLIKHMSEIHNDLLMMHDSMVIREDDLPNTYSHKVGESQSRLMKLSTYDTLFPMTGKKKKRRIEKQDLPGVFTCNQCGKVFSRLRYLRKHALTHQKIPTEKHFACEECGKTFKFKNYLRVHQKSHKNKELKGDKAKHFKCNECDFESNINAAIHAHRQIHNQGLVLCDVCGFAYTDKSTLTKHKRVHDMTRPFACNFPGCTWRFKTEVMCKAHIRAHTTEGKFPCWICGYVFRHKHHLQRHLKKMHNLELSGKELDAHFSAQTRTSAESQEGDHFVGLELQCSDCGLTFVTRSQLDKHLTKAHNISIQDINDFYQAGGDPTTGLLAQTGDGDGKMQMITAIIPEDFEQMALNTGSDQPVYVAIDNASLAQFETDPNHALELNTLYVKEEQEVPISEEEQREEKAFFVSVL